MDDTLRQIVIIPDDVKLSYFNLQKYIKHHYQIPKTEESHPEEQLILEAEKQAIPDETTEIPVKKIIRKKKVKK